MMNRLSVLPRLMTKKHWLCALLLLLALIWVGQTVVCSQVAAKVWRTYELMSVPPPGASGYFNAPDDVFMPGRVSASADGRFVLFCGQTEGWWPGNESLGKAAVWLRDRRTLRTDLVTKSPSGDFPDGFSEMSALSADGRVAVMWSNAFNLLQPPEYMGEGAWTYERKSRVWERMDVYLDGTGTRCGIADPPAISADGRYVAFVSDCDNIVPGDADGDTSMDVFVRDRAQKKTIRVSVSSEGLPPTTPGEHGDCAISGDGKVIAFSSDAGGLAPDVGGGVQRIYVRDIRGTPRTELISKDPDGRPMSGFYPAISADGRYVAYTSMAIGIVRKDKTPDEDVFVYDRMTGSTAWASKPPNFPLVIRGDSWNARGTSALSDDGRFVVFLSNSNKLISSTAGDVVQVVRRDLHDPSWQVITEISTDQFADRDCAAASTSGSGDWVYFQSPATNLISDDANSGSDVLGFLAARSIKGRVTMGDTTPLPGASVLVKGTDGGGTEYWAYTNSEGIYQVNGLTIGNYSITPFKAGCSFQPKQRRITLGESKDSQWFKGQATPGDGVRRHRALLIGVSLYKGGWGWDLKYADKDAEDFKTMLLTGENWDGRDIAMLTNSQATAEAIQEQVVKLGAEADGDDVVVVSFAGHGTWTSDHIPMDEADERDEALATHDYDEHTPILDDELGHLVNRLGTADYMVFLDCCFSGGEISNSFQSDGRGKITARCVEPMRTGDRSEANVDGRRRSEGKSEGLFDGQWLQRGPLKDLNDLGGGAVLTASMEHQKALESYDLRNGVFSHFALEGMRTRAADADGDGWITASELMSHAAPSTSAWVLAHGNRLQNPQHYYGTGGENLAILGPYRTPDLLISVAEGAAVGDDVFSSVALGQRISKRLHQGDEAGFLITLQNQSSSSESFKLTAAVTENPKATLRFLHGRKEITSSLLKAGWVTPRMAPGEELIVTARVQAAAKLRPGYAGNCGFRLTAQMRGISSHLDAVDGWTSIVGPK